ncbi:hypothetical protein D3C79_876290 [compost metagenome]
MYVFCLDEGVLLLQGDEVSMVACETVDSMHDNWAAQPFRLSESQSALWSILGIDGT